MVICMPASSVGQSDLTSAHAARAAVRRDGSLTRSAVCVAPESMSWVVALPPMAGLVSQFNCARSGTVAV